MIHAQVHVIDRVPDCDGVQLGDIDGDGAVDVLSSDGVGGNVFWCRQHGGPRC